MAVFPKSPNTDPLPVYNIPSGTHSEAYLRTDISSYEGSSHFEKKSAFNYETEKLPMHIKYQLSYVYHKHTCISGTRV